MIRIFVLNELKTGSEIQLSETAHHYLRNVMRRSEGDEVLLFNGKDGEWLSKIKTLSKKDGALILSHQTRPQTKENKLILCPALIKKENMDWVFQKATELGVTDIYPLITERTIVPKLNQTRAQSIVQESAEQCERLSVPIIHNPLKLKELFKILPPDIQSVCLSERGTTTAAFSKQNTYAFCIGPEGGWTENELNFFQENNAAFWHLGSTILRAETASVSALACAQFAFKS